MKTGMILQKGILHREEMIYMKKNKANITRIVAFVMAMAMAASVVVGAIAGIV